MNTPKNLTTEEKINAELEALIEEIKKRNSTAVTGVKIPELPEAVDIKGTDLLIIEQLDGTKSISFDRITVTEVIQARTSLSDGVEKQNLDERLEADYNYLDGRITTNANNINDLTQRVTANEGEIATLKNDVQNQNNKIAANEQAVNDLTPKVEKNIQDIIDLQTNIQVVSDKANANEQSINELKPKVEANTQDISSLKNDVLQAKTDIATNTGKIATNENNINLLNDEVVAARNKDAIVHTTLKQRLDSMEDSITNIDGRVTTNTQKIEDNNDLITILDNEIVAARDGQQNLKDRLDSMVDETNNVKNDINLIKQEQIEQNNKIGVVEQKVNDIETDINNSKGTFPTLAEKIADMDNKIAAGGGGGAVDLTEVIEARPSVDGTQHNSLKQRLDHEYNLLDGSINVLQNNLNNLQTEVDEAHGGFTNLKDRIDSISQQAVEAFTKAGDVENIANGNTIEIQNIKNQLANGISYRVI